MGRFFIMFSAWILQWVGFAFYAAGFGTLIYSGPSNFLVLIFVLLMILSGYALMWYTKISFDMVNNFYFSQHWKKENRVYLRKREDDERDELPNYIPLYLYISYFTLLGFLALYLVGLYFYYAIIYFDFVRQLVFLNVFLFFLCCFVLYYNFWAARAIYYQKNFKER